MRSRLCRSARRALVLVVAAVAALGALGGPASALAGEEQFVILADHQRPHVVILTGDVFNGAGTRVFLTRPGTARGNHQQWTFEEGTLFVHAMPLGPRTVHWDETACTATAVGGLSLTVEGGTGVFEGATGGGTFTNTTQSFYWTGPDGCTDQHIYEYTLIEGSMTLDLPAVQGA